MRRYSDREIFKFIDKINLSIFRSEIEDIFKNAESIIASEEQENENAEKMQKALNDFKNLTQNLCNFASSPRLTFLAPFVPPLNAIRTACNLW